MKPIQVFTAFSGYDSQCMALDRIGLPYDLVGWSEIDKYAIAAHNAVYPQFAERNYGDISQIDWSQVPDFDLFTYSSPCQDFSVAGLQRGGHRRRQDDCRAIKVPLLPSRRQQYSGRCPRRHILAVISRKHKQ